jgi:hypothetical protein
MKQLLKRCQFLLGIILLTFNSGAQNENAKWYFGGFVGLDFMTNPPTVLNNGALSTMEGCSTMSDAAGNLLFYTNGITVWNQQHVPMANGTGLLGNLSTTQSALIVKQPGSASLYFIFTMGTGPSGGGPLNYSIVDMTLAAGMGSVTTKNVFLASTSTEKLAAVKHCNGVDAWIVTHDLGNSDFRVFLLTGAGVNATPVMSYSVGASHAGRHSGCLKASLNGTKLGAAIRSTVEVYDFDKLTGVVSNPFNLGNYNYAYGCEFSPDGSKFYVSESILPGNPLIHQWDLCAGPDSAAIAASHTVIGTATGVQELGSVQLALNGKIYIARYFSSDICVINNPNVYGSGCNFVDLGLSIAPQTCRYGLQNCINDLLNPTPPPVCYAYDCNSVTSISSQAANDAIIPEIYPNPVRGNLYVETKTGSRLIILNQLGSTLFDGSFGAGKHTIDMSSFSSGVYIVKSVSDKKLKALRLVKIE